MPLGSAVSGATPSCGPGWPPPVVNWSQTYEVAQEIGPGSINNIPERCDVYGADLGSMFTFGHRLYIVFGDPFGGPAADPLFSVTHANWRSNTTAYADYPAEPERGLRFSGIVTGPDGEANELLSAEKVTGVEETVIPPTPRRWASRCTCTTCPSGVRRGRPLDVQFFGVASATDNGQVGPKNPR